MDSSNRYCVLSIDEMAIRASEKDYDKNSHTVYGNVTLGCDCSVTASHVLVALLRGVKGPWKQVIGAHCTAHSTNINNMRDFITECIACTEMCGLYVIAVSSDMGGSNRNLWKAFEIGVKKNGIRKKCFYVQRI